MIPELGQFALIVALLLALAHGVLPIVGAARGVNGWMRMARPVARAQFVLVAMAFGCLAASFMDNDFSVLYVADEFEFDAAAASIASRRCGAGTKARSCSGRCCSRCWMAAVSRVQQTACRSRWSRACSRVMSWISAGFLLFMLFTSNPFARLLPPAMDGRDLNPLLQDPGMVSHPPMLYMGYVGFSVAFAFAIAALLVGRTRTPPGRAGRGRGPPPRGSSSRSASCSAAAGPTTNSAGAAGGSGTRWRTPRSCPGSSGTALMHSLAVTEKRGGFRSWTVLLAICTFSLSLLGTFLVRSGVLTSVHAFASDPARGLFILVFLSVVIGGALLLFAWRAPKVGLGGGFALVSRESLLLSNNVLLMVAAASVLLGTLYPLVLDVLGLGKISVGPPYFDAVFVPLMTPAVFLMGIGPIARWKAARLPDLAVRLRWAGAAQRGRGARAAVARWRMSGRWSALGVLLAAWSVSASMRQRWSSGSRNSRGRWSRASGVCRARSTACCSRTSASACSSSA